MEEEVFNKLLEEVKSKQQYGQKYKLIFSEPVLYKYKHKTKEVKTFIVRCIFFSLSGHWCYSNRVKVRSGYMFDQTMKEKLISIEYINNTDNFEDFKVFKKQFNSRYISDEKIKQLWESNSAQTGRNYNKKDFKQMSKSAMNLFLLFDNQFIGISKLAVEMNSHYHESPFSTKENPYKVLTIHSKAYRTRGKNITISHQSNNDIVHYSNEFSGCGSGSYGIVVRKGVWLHLEDD